jgi:hypothetical protein
MCYKSFNLQSELNIHIHPYIFYVCHELGIRAVWSYTNAHIVENVHMPLMFVIKHWRYRVISMYINTYILENIIPVMCVINHSGCCIIWRHISEYIENIHICVILVRNFSLNRVICSFTNTYSYTVENVHIRGLSGKYPAIFNISRTGRVTLM